jgi:hypothetical protein
MVWPFLKEQAFDDFTPRSAWRRRSASIDVVNVQSVVGKGGFPLSLGNGTDATLGSFAVNVGTYYTIRKILPWPPAVGMVPDAARPAEWVCDERLQLGAQLPQSKQYPSAVWEAHIDDPLQLQASVTDACQAIRSQALPWFEKNQDLEQALARLKPGCWSCATNLDREPDRFFRNEDLFSALALELGRVDEALRLFEAISSRSFDPEMREQYLQEESRRQARLARSKGRVVIGTIPFWHDGALARLELLKRSR